MIKRTQSNTQLQHDNNALDQSTLSTITAATNIGGDICVLVAGSGCKSVADEAASVAGVSKVLMADNEAYANGIAENVCELVEKNLDGITHILASSTNSGKNVLPRLSAKLDAAQISDITGVTSEDTFERACYAGNAITKVQTSDTLKLLTVCFLFVSFLFSLSYAFTDKRYASRYVERHLRRLLRREEAVL